MKSVQSSNGRSPKSCVPSIREKELVRELEEAKARVEVLEREAVEIAAREHRRIGEYLHDNVGQLVTGIGFLSESLCQRLEGESDADLAREIRALAVQVLSETRHLSRGFFAVSLESHGLGYALVELCDFIAKTFGVACRFSEPELHTPVSADQASHLYRIAQEAINNALKHGDATRIQVDLVTHETAGFLRVWNNGKPFAPTGDSDGIGLAVMRNRAEQIGGKISYHSDEDGVQMMCCFPLHHMGRRT